mgnify:CR=1 FL=1
MKTTDLFVSIFNEGLDFSEMNAVRGGTAHSVCTCQGGFYCPCHQGTLSDPIGPLCPCLNVTKTA